MEYTHCILKPTLISRLICLRIVEDTLNDYHGGNVLSDNLKEKKDLVTFKICGKKQQRDQIQRHLKLAHKMEKKVEEGKKTNFRVG